MRYPQGYPPVCQRPLFGHILQTTCTYRPTRCGSLRFRMFCVLCQDSLRGVSSVNLECGFVWVWPQRQTFVGKSLTLTIQNRTSAQSSRPTFLQLLHAPQRHHRLRNRNGRLTRPCRGALRIQSRDRDQVEHPA